MPTKIQWAEETWNPTVGCSKVSPGCRECYAIRDARRLSGNPNPKIRNAYKGTTTTNGKLNWTGAVKLIPERLQIPLRRKKPTRWFVNSMSDLFHEVLSDEAIDQVFAVMALCPQHVFMVLTKRAERMKEWCNGASHVRREMRSLAGKSVLDLDTLPWPLPNVWLGISAENQKYADERIPLLLGTPAAVRFVSYEPALTAVDFTRIDHRKYLRDGLVKFARWNAREDGEDQDKAAEDARKEIPDGDLSGDEPMLNALTGESFDGWDSASCSRIDWVIAGGESGPGARPSDPEWFRSLRDQCVAAKVPFSFKQWGGVDKKAAGRLLDGRTWDEFPEEEKA